MTTNLTGIVININDYEENDEIITVFTKELGLITFIARGVKKITSKNKISLSWLAISNFELFLSSHPNRMSKLMRGTLINNHFKIIQSAQATIFLSWFTELIISAFESHQPHPPSYELFKDCLTSVNDDNDLLLIVDFFMFKALD